MPSNRPRLAKKKTEILIFLRRKQKLHQDWPVFLSAKLLWNFNSQIKVRFFKKSSPATAKMATYLLIFLKLAHAPPERQSQGVTNAAFESFFHSNIIELCQVITWDGIHFISKENFYQSTSITRIWSTCKCEGPTFSWNPFNALSVSQGLIKRLIKYLFIFCLTRELAGRNYKPTVVLQNKIVTPASLTMRAQKANSRIMVKKFRR